jgi:hypothetical protein
VLWKSLPIGSYTITLNQAGYIDSKGNQLSQTKQNVVAKKVAFPTIRYDKPARANVAVTTHIPGTSWSATNSRTSRAVDVSATNGAEVGFFRTFTPASPSSSFQVNQLFPFATNAYSFFSGRCGWAHPDKYDPNYFSAVNPAAGLLADPNVVKNVEVRQPPFNIRVQRERSGNTPAENELVIWAKLLQPDGSTEECANPYYELTNRPWPGSGWGTVKTGQWVSKRGGDFDPGMPFGEYQLCLMDGSRGSMVSAPYVHTAPNGVSTTVVLNQSSWDSDEDCWH